MDSVLALEGTATRLLGSVHRHTVTQIVRSQHGHYSFYTNGEDWIFNPQYQEYDEKYKARFRFRDTDGRLWADDNLTAKGLTGGGYTYEYKGVTSLWRVPLETMQQLDAEGRLHFTRRAEFGESAIWIDREADLRRRLGRH